MAKSDNTKDRIITAAKKVYKSNGYKNVSMDLIAQEANVSKSLLTHYYKKKHIILTNINRTYLDSIGKFVMTLLPDDPLTVLMVTYRIFHMNILSDPQTKKFWFDAMLRTDIGMESYDNSDIVYMPVFKKYNAYLGKSDLKIRKIQILGAGREMSYVYFHKMYDMSDEEYIQKNLEHAAMLLGAPNYDIINCTNKGKELLKNIDYSRFKLLD